MSADVARHAQMMSRLIMADGPAGFRCKPAVDPSVIIAERFEPALHAGFRGMMVRSHDDVIVIRRPGLRDSVHARQGDDDGGDCDE